MDRRKRIVRDAARPPDSVSKGDICRAVERARGIRTGGEQAMGIRDVEVWNGGDSRMFAFRVIPPDDAEWKPLSTPQSVKEFLEACGRHSGVDITTLRIRFTEEDGVIGVEDVTGDRDMAEILDDSGEKRFACLPPRKRWEVAGP